MCGCQHFLFLEKHPRATNLAYEGCCNNVALVYMETSVYLSDRPETLKLCAVAWLLCIINSKEMGTGERLALAEASQLILLTD